MMKKKQSWCFDNSDVVELKPVSSRICIRQLTPNINPDEIHRFGMNALSMSNTEAEDLRDTLMTQGEWLVGVYSSDMAETIVGELSSLIKDHGINLLVSINKE